MIGRVHLAILCGALLAVSMSASSAAAQGFGAGGYGLGFYNYGGAWAPNIPYYALYPPVYYSYPVARPYGYSPFAYPPGTATPAAPAPSAEYRNPFVPPKAETKPASDHTAAVARMYYNPFVKQAATDSTPSLAKRAEH